MPGSAGVRRLKMSRVEGRKSAPIIHVAQDSKAHGGCAKLEGWQISNDHSSRKRPFATTRGEIGMNTPEPISAEEPVRGEGPARASSKKHATVK